MTTLSLDIETHGAIAGLPGQRHFHPMRTIRQDRVPASQMIINATITICSPDLVPGNTMTFDFTKPSHRKWLAAWLTSADTIIGMNLPFDILYLRASSSQFRTALSGTQHLIDLSILNYLHSELRTERSLKALGPVLGTHIYERTIKDGRFSSPHCKEFLAYCAADTHNTALACAELRRRIAIDWPLTDKLSPHCMKFYSDTTWTVIRMAEAGIPMHLDTLRYLERTLTRTIDDATTGAATHGLQLEGTGSAKSKDSFTEACLAICPEVLDHPLTTYTPKTRKFSFSDGNRNLLLAHLPATETSRIAALQHATSHQQAQKQLSTYVVPLLRHRRNDPDVVSARAIPTTNRSLGMAYPTWYIIPSSAKESSSEDSGGTIQGRITCKNPSAQTFPPAIKACICSRWPGGTILTMDLSQVELRVAALCSGDGVLLAAFNDGLDLHSDRALEIFGSSIANAPDFRTFWRQVGKTINFADLFLASAFRMRMSVHEMTGTLLPLSLFQRIEQQRPQSRPGLWAWQQSLIALADAQGYLILPFMGQSRTFTGGAKAYLNEIVNFPIQTQASNTLIHIQHHLHRHLRPLSSLDSTPCTTMFLQIYDSIYLDVPEGQIPEAKAQLADAVSAVTSPSGYWHMLQQYYGHEVPLLYDVTTH